MGEGELEDVMLKFIRHEADILVCTTIIESGLDIPNANTILINNADRFGLSELHQLRGRVGRYKHRAYCYLLLPADRPVTAVAAKRLKAIEEYSHLGAGFKIAMRDLEIRGAGNILGPEQSGHIATVGYEMYCQLLEEATSQLKNEPQAAQPEAHVDIGVTAFLPKTYIPGDRQRMDLYRRLTRCTDLDMLQMLEQDMKDAFGEPPRQAMVFLALTELRLLAQMYGISSIIRKEPDVVLTVRDATESANRADRRSRHTSRHRREDGLSPHAANLSGVGNAADGAEEFAARSVRPREKRHDSCSASIVGPQRARHGQGVDGTLRDRTCSVSASRQEGTSRPEILLTPGQRYSVGPDFFAGPIRADRVPRAGVQGCSAPHLSQKRSHHSARRIQRHAIHDMPGQAGRMRGPRHLRHRFRQLQPRQGELFGTEPDGRSINSSMPRRNERQILRQGSVNSADKRPECEGDHPRDHRPLIGA